MQTNILLPIQNIEKCLIYALQYAYCNAFIISVSIDNPEYCGRPKTLLFHTTGKEYKYFGVWDKREGRCGIDMYVAMAKH